MTTTTHRHQLEIDRRSSPAPDTTSDIGATLLELLFVVLILALLASAVVFAVSGVRADAADSGCAADHRTLAVAAEAYFAQHDADRLPADGVDHDRFERALVGAHLLRGISSYHDLDADGVITTEGDSTC